jgi:hypothetical protein
LNDTWCTQARRAPQSVSARGWSSRRARRRTIFCRSSQGPITAFVDEHVSVRCNPAMPVGISSFWRVPLALGEFLSLESGNSRRDRCCAPRILPSSSRTFVEQRTDEDSIPSYNYAKLACGSLFMGQSKPISPRNTATERLSRPTFEAHVSQGAKNLEDQAWRLPPGPERDALLRRARHLDVAAHLSDWLASPGLKPPA